MSYLATVDRKVTEVRNGKFRGAEVSSLVSVRFRVVPTAKDRESQAAGTPNRAVPVPR